MEGLIGGEESAPALPRPFAKSRIPSGLTFTLRSRAGDGPSRHRPPSAVMPGRERKRGSPEPSNRRPGLLGSGLAAARRPGMTAEGLAMTTTEPTNSIPAKQPDQLALDAHPVGGQDADLVGGVGG